MRSETPGRIERRSLFVSVTRLDDPAAVFGGGGTIIGRTLEIAPELTPKFTGDWLRR